MLGDETSSISLPSGSRDRTEELHTIMRRLRAANPSAAHPPPTRKNVPSSAEFHSLAARCTHELHETSSLLEKLTLLMKQRGLFADRAEEVQKLILLLKDRMARSQDEIKRLSALKTSQRSWRDTMGGVTSHADSHSSAVVSTLESQLATAAQSFASVLQQRNSAVAAQVQRRRPMVADAGEIDAVMRSLSAPDVEQTQVLSDRVVTNDYYRQRGEAMQQVSGMVEELMTMFTHMSALVERQDESILTIDADLSATEEHIEGAQQALLRRLASVSNNRTFILKIFAILVFFLMIFGVFFLK